MEEEDEGQVQPTSYTLHHTPYTLHSTPFTLHPTPYTLHPAPYTLHLTPYTLHPTPYTLHPTQDLLAWRREARLNLEDEERNTRREARERVEKAKQAKYDAEEALRVRRVQEQVRVKKISPELIDYTIQFEVFFQLLVQFKTLLENCEWTLIRILQNRCGRSVQRSTRVRSTAARRC